MFDHGIGPISRGNARIQIKGIKLNDRWRRRILAQMRGCTGHGRREIHGWTVTANGGRYGDFASTMGRGRMIMMMMVMMLIVMMMTRGGTVHIRMVGGRGR